MSHTSHAKQALLKRVRRIAGQVAALEKALQADEDCGKVLVQMAAAKGAMQGLMMEVLAGQISGHLADEADAERRRQEAQALVKLLQTHLK
ncbi:metal/formaldehyde-sensitive transcriptional repressor [Xanthomonas massiliensis]|jgi:DNA-binding FrmR family transcriptional regulator|uniref:metal/formaldehyde-sensitive transcriptional repressor n=1 Tax=Xanthomonas massiliensis TaxID=1720302 RepID=UPI0008249C85|nr:metal/formaldehyde-sensitive transcriptional repressor [Xanthomonas massiliensis]